MYSIRWKCIAEELLTKPIKWHSRGLSKPEEKANRDGQTSNSNFMMAFLCSGSPFLTLARKALPRIADQAVKLQQARAVDFAQDLKEVSTAKD